VLRAPQATTPGRQASRNPFRCRRAGTQWLRRSARTRPRARHDRSKTRARQLTYAPAHTSSGGAATRAAGQIRGVFRGSRHFPCQPASRLAHACQSRGEKLRGVRGSRRLVHERIARLTPPRRMSTLDFANALQNRLPEIAQHTNGRCSIAFLFSISQTTASSTSVPVPPLHAT